MEQYKTEINSSKQSDLDNFLQQLDFKISRLVQVRERLESKVEKMYGGILESAVKSGNTETTELVIVPTSDILKYKLDRLEALIEDISNLTTSIEEFI